MPTNPYATAARVDPQREQQALLKLKQNPQKLAELGLAPDEDFSTIKSDPVKYNRVLSYVKGEAYKNPAYSAVTGGVTKPEFAQGQLGPDYSKTASEYSANRGAELKSTYNVDPLKSRADEYQAGSYSALPRITEEVKKKGGYDVEGLKDNFTKLQTGYADAYRRFVAGELAPAEYAAKVSELSTTARSLEKAQTGLKQEVDAAVGNYNTSAARAKNEFDNAYAKYAETLKTDTAGYADTRAEKLKAAEAMYESVKSLLDEAQKDAKGELREVGGNLYQVTYDDAGKAVTKLVQRKGGGGTGGGDGTIPVAPISIVPGQQPVAAGPTFEEFVKQKQNEQGISFTPAAKAKLKVEYDQKFPAKPQQSTQTTAADISKFDPTVQRIIRGTMKVEDVGEVEYRKLKNQINQAEQMGLIKTADPNKYTPENDNQAKSAGFATRISEANKIFEDIEPDINNLSASRMFYERKAPNLLKSETFQQQEQAERDFINAVLRRESGAAISPSEFESAAKQYFPQPGDSNSVLQQKKKNRATIFNNISREAGEGFKVEDGVPAAAEEKVINGARYTKVNGGWQLAQ